MEFNLKCKVDEDRDREINNVSNRKRREEEGEFNKENKGDINFWRKWDEKERIRKV